MKNEKLLDALGKIDDNLIEEAAPGNKPPKRQIQPRSWVKLGATMAACTLLVVGIGMPYIVERKETTSKKTGVEESSNTTTTLDDTKDTIGLGETTLGTMTHMTEIKIKIDEMLPDGFIGTIEVGTDLFEVGKQISVIAQDNVTVVQKDGSIFDYDELEPNIPDSDLTIGSTVWVGFQSYDYVEGNGKYNQIFAYHIAEKDKDITNDDSSAEGVIVDEGFPDWGLTLSVKDVTESGLTLVCTQSGGELTGELQTGSDYKLKVLKEAWEDVPPIIEDYGWTTEAYMVTKNDVTEFEIKWEWLYGKLPAGTYRLVKGFTGFRESGDYGNFAYWIEFKIK